MQLTETCKNSDTTERMLTTVVKLLTVSDGSFSRAVHRRRSSESSCQSRSVHITNCRATLCQRSAPLTVRLSVI